MTKKKKQKNKEKTLINKIIDFVKYHNAFTISLVLVVIISGSAMASEGVRNAVIGQKTVQRQGIDNTMILSADIDNLDFKMRIESVTEDEKNYYVKYSYDTIAIQNNIWQSVFKEGILTVSKRALSGRDLGFYVSEELGEIIDNQLAYLREVQEIESQKGKTLVYQTTKYTGLVGLVLNSETKVLPGYEPIVRPVEPQILAHIDEQETEQFFEQDSDIWQDFEEEQDALVSSDNNFNTPIPTSTPTPTSSSSGGSSSGGGPVIPEPTPDPDPEPSATSTEPEQTATTTEPEVPTEGSPTSTTTDSEPEPEPEVETCEESITYYLDADGDGYGNLETSTSTCEQPTSYVLDNTDCDDSMISVYPGAVEVCNGLDNNCNREADEGCDCGQSVCNVGLNLIGQCDNFCMGELGCGTCEPTCFCTEGWTDCDNDMNNGCETQGECVALEPEPEPEPEPEGGDE